MGSRLRNLTFGVLEVGVSRHNGGPVKAPLKDLNMVECCDVRKVSGPHAADKYPSLSASCTLDSGCLSSCRELS